MRFFCNSLLIILFSSVLLFGCKNTNQLKNGSYRATLKTESGTVIPFNFTLSDSSDKKVLHIINGSEKFMVDEITVEGDSLRILMPVFDSEILARIGNGSLEGRWIKHLADEDAVMDFEAESETNWRFFEKPSAPKYNMEGRWSTTFTSEDMKDTTVAVGEFKQKGNQLTGTFLSTTGDYRFLEGTVSGDKLFLSCFDGSNAYLFTGQLSDGNITNGKFYSGYSSVKNWTAKKDDKAILPDAYSLTELKGGNSTIQFSFPDLDGHQISLSDDKFKGKVTIVQFLGSWCPNCMDETAYLSPFYKKYKDKGVEIVGLAYERSADIGKAKKNVGRLKKRFDIDYSLLLTGYTNDKDEVVKSIPALKNFMAFPTTLIIDKNGKVRKIHTGFSGPGTGEHYTAFVNEFESLINNLLAEK